MGMTVSLTRLLLRSGLRGRTRATLFLANRLPSLQSVPITLHGLTLFLDLRVGSTHAVFAGSEYEPLEQEIMRECVKEGDAAFDIGAHIGAHTVLLSSLVGPTGHVYAFEPNPLVLPALRKTAEELGNVTLFEIALSDSTASVPFFVPGDQSMASLRNWTEGRHGGISTLTCQTATLDSLGLPAPAFIKCDVEGGELAVFQGASSVLSRPNAPMILFEMNATNARGFELSEHAASDYLASLGYKTQSASELNVLATKARLSYESR